MKSTLLVRITALFFLLAVVSGTQACKTSSKCDCPTFGRR